MESVLGADSTVQSLCEDIVAHYERYRANLLTGKAMIVAYSRPIAMKIYRKDDMQEVYGYLRNADMLILASPVDYHGISGRLKCTIDRFYSSLYPTAPVSLTKTAMFLSSGGPEMYEGAKFSFEGDFLSYPGLENMGMFTCAGDVKESVLEEIRKMASSL